MCRLRLNHLKRQESAVVPGMREEIRYQLSWTLWMSATDCPSHSQCLQISQISIFKSQTLQFRFNFRVLVILHTTTPTSQSASLSPAAPSPTPHCGRSPPQSTTAPATQSLSQNHDPRPTRPQTASASPTYPSNPPRNCSHAPTTRKTGPTDPHPAPQIRPTPTPHAPQPAHPGPRLSLFPALILQP